MIERRLAGSVAAQWILHIRLLIEETDGKAQVKLLLCVRQLTLDTIENRRVFRVGIGLGVEFLDDHFAVAGTLEFTEQIFDALREGLQTDRHHTAALGVIETDLYRRLELADDRFRPLR